MSSRVWLRRAYDDPTRNDGTRILVDRVWPRGRRREDLRIDDWPKEIAPTTDLRKWFGHDPDRWDEFRRRYRGELGGGAASEAVDAIVERARTGRVTLVYGAKDTEHNQAVVLREVIEERLGNA